MKAAIVLALLLAGCDRAPFVKAPPARYQANGTYFVQTVKTEDVPKACAGASTVGEPRGSVVVGCAKGIEVIVPNPCEWPDPYAQVMCHELGHLQGWPASHPDQ